MPVKLKKLSPEEHKNVALLAPETNYWRPRTRSECANVARPCPYVSCRHHLYLDIQSNGKLRINHKNREPGELQHSCSLDIADRGARDRCNPFLAPYQAERPFVLDYSEVGVLLGITGESVRLIEKRAFAKLRREYQLLGIHAEATGYIHTGELP